MTLITVNGQDYVLISQMANLLAAPQWQRTWNTQISSAVAGNESRNAMRKYARSTLSWTVTGGSIAEQQSFEDTIRAALKNGYACAPFWGRGTKLTADVTNTAVALDGTWTFKAGDFIYFLDQDTHAFNVRQISSVGPIVLSVGVSQTFHAGALAWPVIFGKFSCQKLNADSASIGSTQVTITELVAPSTATVGATTPGDGGIGDWEINNTFIVGAP